jgi:hypothetical protein
MSPSQKSHPHDEAKQNIHPKNSKIQIFKLNTANPLSYPKIYIHKKTPSNHPLSHSALSQCFPHPHPTSHTENQPLSALIETNNSRNLSRRSTIKFDITRELRLLSRQITVAATLRSLYLETKYFGRELEDFVLYLAVLLSTISLGFT